MRPSALAPPALTVANLHLPVHLHKGAGLYLGSPKGFATVAGLVFGAEVACLGALNRRARARVGEAHLKNIIPNQVQGAWVSGRSLKSRVNQTST